MVADALASCIAKSEAAMLFSLTVWVDFKYPYQIISNIGGWLIHIWSSVVEFYYIHQAFLGTMHFLKLTSMKQINIISEECSDSVWPSDCVRILNVFAMPITRSTWTRLLAILLSWSTVFDDSRFFFWKRLVCSLWHRTVQKCPACQNVYQP